MKADSSLAPLALLGLMWSCLSLTSCGGGASARSAPEAAMVFTETSSAPRPRLVHGHLVGDDDMENDDSPHGGDDVPIRAYGRSASAAAGRAVTSLVERYYSAAARGQLRAACAMLSARISRDPSVTRTVPEDRFSARLGPAIRRGETCTQATARQFEHNRRRLAGDVGSLQVVSVRVEGAHGVALLGFRRTLERWIPVVRERGSWRVDFLLDRELP